VFHRVIFLTDDGYIIRGDNCYADETVPENAVIGVLTEFFRKDRHFISQDKKYLSYAKKRVKRYKFRRLCVRVKGFIRNLLKK
jgi:hypothetical protein